MGKIVRYYGMSDDKQPEPEPPKQDAPEEDDKLSEEPEGNIEKMVERGRQMGF